MFDKKIIFISFISLLLITGSFYIILHPKKDNDDEVIIVDNSDDLNEEESIDEYVESSSPLLFVIIVIVIIIVIAAIFFFIFYRKNKKEKVENPGKEATDNKNNVFEEPKKIIENNDEDENNKNPIFKEYRNFKKNAENKTKIEAVQQELRVGIIVQNLIKNLEQMILTNLKDNKVEINNYSPNKFLIDFNYPFANDEIKKPYEENNKIVYRFNIKEHENLLNEILSKLFETIASCKLFVNDSFNSKNENEQKDILYIFITVIIEPFLENIGRKIYLQNNTIIFVNQNDNGQDTFKSFLTKLIDTLNLGEGKKTTTFLTYVAKTDFFSSIFNELIKKYFKFNFVFEKNEVIENK